MSEDKVLGQDFTVPVPSSGNVNIDPAGLTDLDKAGLTAGQLDALNEPTAVDPRSPLADPVNAVSESQAAGNAAAGEDNSEPGSVVVDADESGDEFEGGNAESDLVLEDAEEGDEVATGTIAELPVD